MQQKKVIEDHTALKVGFYTGDMGVDFWDRDRWRDEFNTNDVLVMTAQILLNILTHAFINLKNINLLILDECHNASGKHPYSKILQMFDDDDGRVQPHIMGLTASIINEKYRKDDDEYMIKEFLERKMKELENRMRAVCMTCSDFEATARFATKPVETIKQYDLGFEVNEFFGIEKMIDTLKKELQSAQLLFSEFSDVFILLCKMFCSLCIVTKVNKKIKTLIILKLYFFSLKADWLKSYCGIVIVLG